MIKLVGTTRQVPTRRGQARTALSGIVGDVDVYKLLPVVAYTRREGAFIADTGDENGGVVFVRIGNTWCERKRERESHVNEL